MLSLKKGQTEVIMCGNGGSACCPTINLSEDGKMVKVTDDYNGSVQIPRDQWEKLQQVKLEQ